jgi:MFS family permease
VVLFDVGSVICGAAPTTSTLIVGRVIAGVGGSGIYFGSLNYFLAMAAPEERSFYVALIRSSWGVGAILSPVVGGESIELKGGMKAKIQYNTVRYHTSPGICGQERGTPHHS